MRLLLLLCVLSCAAATEDERPNYPSSIHEMVKAHLAASRRSRTTKGHWGPWSGWTECSSSCGGGVRSQTRQCLPGPLKPTTGRRRSKQHHGCLGLYRRYHVCNTQQLCPAGTDLREAQCATFDPRPFGGRVFQWKPFLDAPNQCQLNCRAEGQRFYATLNQSVVDGTACRPPQGPTGRPVATERWVCVSGECKHVGCDGVVGSERRWDACGECGGRNTSCRIVSGIFSNHANLQVGVLSNILTLPRGACNISAVQAAPSTSRLVLRRTATAQPISFESAAFNHHPAEGTRGEFLTARGPLLEAVDLALLYGGGPLGVRYQFGLPTNEVVQQDDASALRPRRRPRKFSWHMVAASECSKSCGGGVQAVKFVCTREGGGHVPEKRCSHLERPTARSMKCNVRPCPAEWEYGPWGPCSASCGPGTQARTVACRQHISATMTNMKVNEAACLGQREPRTQPCNQGPCDGPRSTDVFDGPSDSPQGHWLTTVWSEGCACGSGLQTRRVACSTLTCDPAQRPSETRPCARACREAQWFTGPWSQCSAHCGPGRQSRPVLCLKAKAAVDEEHCAAHDKPLAERACEERPCGGQWFASEWGACEEDCGPQSREVRCLDEAAKAAEDCANDERPAARRPCSSCSKSLEQNLVSSDLPRAQLLARSEPEVENCKDALRDCGLVLRARLCGNRYYRTRCCVTCSRVTP
ncbi:A disintegrin and metalloproteinase with thrombospondin motifs 10 isoform X2 [Neocloeon triangulifer]|uniref:A disintegrin and metalloproteinase with thrombospondin motifs 10 isoform X2 n=1 Tax=Neocloeon triangulifer TaxID=2078957 RepID=UPI00286ED6DB|nr:A disintegrin and metalloproteinase with thrombospondin motifs 10 isoform X2 [Neocloeon triangulifer]